MANHDRTTKWLREQVAGFTPASERSAKPLFDTFATLDGDGGLLFGMVQPAGYVAPPELRHEIVMMLVRWMPQLDRKELEQLRTCASRAGVAVPGLDDRIQQLYDAAVRAHQAQQAAMPPARSVAPAPRDEPIHAELERAIDEDPEATNTYEVLADWLETRGAARGELIALQLRAERDPAFLGAVDRFVNSHAKELLGSLCNAPYVADGSGEPTFVWRRGFIDRAVISVWPDAVEEEDFEDYPDPGELLRDVLAAPSARHLRSLVLRVAGSDSEPSVAELIDEVVANPRRSLRSLQLGDAAVLEDLGVSSFEVGELAGLWDAIPMLTELIVHGGTFALGDSIDLPQLRRLVLRSGALGPEHILAIAGSGLETLEQLELYWYGYDEESDADLEETFAAMGALLGRRAPIRELVLRGVPWGDEVCGLIAKSPWLGSLRSLDLGDGNIGDAGGHALVGIPRLERLDLSRNRLTRDGIAAVRALAQHVATNDQA